MGRKLDMKKLLTITLLVLVALLLAAAGVPQHGLQVIVSSAPVTTTATPGFVSETSKNSLGSIALATQFTNMNACPSYDYCLPYVENALGGNIGIVPFIYSSSPTPTIGVTDDKSDTYSCVAPSSASSSLVVDICYAPNLIAGAHNVDVSFAAANTHVAAKVSMAYNVATSSPLDTSNSCVGTSSTTVNCANVTTGFANDYIYVAVCRTGTPVATSFTAGSGYTLGTTDIQGGCATEYGVATSAGSVTPSMTMSPASTYIEYVLAFKAATAGVAPSGFYQDRLLSWSTQSGVSGNVSLQFPTSGNLLVAMESGNTIDTTSITDSGNTWSLAGTDNNTNSTAYYVPNASADSSGLLTMNTTGTGDSTYQLYSFTGAIADPYINWQQVPLSGGTVQCSGGITACNVLNPTSGQINTWTPPATSYLAVTAGQQGFNTSVSIGTPTGWFWDGGFFGGETLNGGGTPESVVDQNNVWAHGYSTTLGTQTTFSINQTTTFTNSTASNFNVDLLTFLTSTGIGIKHFTSNQATSGSTLAITVPATKANLLVISTGFYDGSTVRTVSKVCTDGTTCAAGHSFTQLTSAASTDTSSTSGTDIWYCLSCTSGATTVTISYSGAVTTSEGFYWEVQKGSGASWAADGGAHVNAGTTSGTTSTGAAVTPTGTQDFCVGHIDVSGSGVSANPLSGNAFVYPGTTPDFSGTGGAAASLLTTSSSAQTPQWTTSTGTFNSSTGCFK